MNGAVELLKRSSVIVSPETFSFVSLSRDAWNKLLLDPQLSPRMTVPFMIFMDGHEVTLMLDETDLSNMRRGFSDAKIEEDLRLLTFSTVMDLSVVGFMAEVSRILADAGISILPIASFSRDSILIKQDSLAKALRALGPHVDSIC